MKTDVVSFRTLSAFMLATCVAGMICLFLGCDEPVAIVEDVPETEFIVPAAPLVPGDFTLTERSGREFNSSEMEGKVWVAGFFFTGCTSLCREQNLFVQKLQAEYGDDGVQFLSITCDPENDTPETLAEYAKLFDADAEKWFFLTGDLDYLKQVGNKQFQLAVAEKTHSERLVVIDKWGTMRGNFHWTDPEDAHRMKKKIETLLAETEPPNKEASKAKENASGE